VMSRTVRTIGWFVIGDAALVLLLIALDLRFAKKIPIEENETLMVFFGAHGIIFNGLLPLAVVLLPLAGISWIVLRIAASKWR
jgi:hypothetical protein